MSDICLAELLLALGFTSRVVLHAKPYPWFVSDTIATDIKYCIEKLQQSDRLVQKTLADKWIQRNFDGM